jgi:hypothetical protein
MQFLAHAPDRMQVSVAPAASRTPIEPDLPPELVHVA